MRKHFRDNEESLCKLPDEEIIRSGKGADGADGLNTSKGIL
jgi:hypothetical protein